MLRIEWERRRLGWSQGDLKEESGVSQKDISLIESSRLIPTTNQVARLAQALGLKTDVLLQEVTLREDL